MSIRKPSVNNNKRSERAAIRESVSDEKKSRRRHLASKPFATRDQASTAHTPRLKKANQAHTQTVVRSLCNSTHLRGLVAAPSDDFPSCDKGDSASLEPLCKSSRVMRRTVRAGWLLPSHLSGAKMARQTARWLTRLVIAECSAVFRCARAR